MLLSFSLGINIQLESVTESVNNIMLATKLGYILFKFISCLGIWILLSFTLLPVILLLLTIRWFTSKLVPLFYKHVDKIIPTTSSIFIPPKGSESPTVVVLCFVLEGKVDLDEVCSTFQSRVIQKRNPKGNLQWPELQQRIVYKLGYPFWEWDKSFNVQKHVRMVEDTPSKSHQHVWKPQEVLDLIEENIIHSPFPSESSPWEIRILHNFQDTPKYGNSEIEDGQMGTILLFKADHALGDGTSMAAVFEECFNGEMSYGMKSGERISTLSRLWKDLNLYFHLVYEMVSFGTTISKYNWTPNNKVTRYNSALSPTIPFELIKNIRKNNNVSFSAVLLALLSNALFKFMKDAEYDVPQTVWCCLPRVVHGHPRTQLRNYINSALVALPLGQTELGRIDASIKNATSSQLPEMLSTITKLIGTLWQSLIPREGHEGEILLTNIKFFEEEQKFKDTHKLRSVFVRGRLPMGGNGIVVLAVSCKEGIRFLFQIDEGIIPKNSLHAEVFVQYFLQELETMRNKTPPN